MPVPRWQSPGQGHCVLSRGPGCERLDGAAPRPFGSSCLGSNPRGQVVVVVGTGHHALVVFWQVF